MELPGLNLRNDTNNLNVITSNTDVVIKSSIANDEVKLAVGGIVMPSELLDVRTGLFPITDQGARIGEAKLGTRRVSAGEGEAGFSHQANFNSSDYAILQTHDGITKINAKQDKNISFLLGGTENVMTIEKNNEENNINISGVVNATKFKGDASGLTNLR